MWVIGGDDGTNKNDVWYSTDGQTWTQVTSSAQWSPRRYHTSLVYDNAMWVLGGNDGDMKNDVWYSSLHSAVMKMMSNGNVGIGTTNPQGKLDISGGCLAVGGSCGTAGQFLQTQVTGANPMWATPNQSGCSAYMSSGQSITAGGFVKINFNATLYDALSEFDTANNRFVAATTGKYLIIAKLMFNKPLPAGENNELLIYKNGSSVKQNRTYSSDGFNTHMEISGILNLVAGNYVEIYVFLQHDCNTGTLAGDQALIYLDIQKLN